MKYYQDTKLLPDTEIPLYFIRNKTISKLHKTLHDQEQTAIGVSFPGYKVKLGDTIRLHGSQADLQSLHASNWLGGLSGYCQVSDILPVPETVEGYRTISRIQPTMTIAKLKKRIEYQRARGDLKTDEEVKAYEMQYKAKMFAESLDNPYLELQSNSTGESYRIFIKLGEVQSLPVPGKFNSFGLSKQATVPWF